MVDIFVTEEEQVEAIKRWWKENGNSTLISIGAGFLLYFGWQSWQDNKQASAEAASVIYQQILMTTEQTSEKPSPELYGQLASMADQIQADYPGSGYATYTALVEARFLVDQGMHDAAIANLNEVLATKPDEPIRVVTELRLGQILLDQGKSAEALSIAAKITTGPFAAAYAELTGDAEAMAGNIPAARAAYQRAIELSSTAEGGGPGFVQVKLDSLISAPSNLPLDAAAAPIVPPPVSTTEPITTTTAAPATGEESP